MKTFPVTLNKKTKSFTPIRLTMYKQSKILEATDSKQMYYYFVFYKNKFLNGVKADQIKLGSHLHKALQNGLTLDGNHPIVQQLIETHSFSISRFNHLYKKIEQQYSPTETVLILTLFNSFIKDTEIQKLLKKVYYQYRRDGQMFKAFKLAKLLSQYTNDRFVMDMISNMQFQKFEEKYQDKNWVVSKDPLYFEASCYENLQQSESLDNLISLYQKQERTLDELIIRLHKLTVEFNPKNIERIMFILQENFQPNEQTSILTQLSQNNSSSPELKEILLSNLLSLEQHNETVRFVVTSNVIPSKDQLTKLTTSFKQADNNVLTSLFSKLSHRLIQLYQEDHKSLEQVVIRCISAFFQTYTVEQICTWFKPFHDANIHLPIENKLKKMKVLEDDPDQQFILGELYLDFKQLEKSIDCFKWEMELKPKDPKPVQFLNKIYKELGMKDEANTYQQLLIHMGK